MLLKLFNRLMDKKINFYFQFVFLPECCDYVGMNKDEAIALSESLDGPTVQFYRDLAKTNGIWMSLGGIHEAITDNVS